MLGKTRLSLTHKPHTPHSTWRSNTCHKLQPNAQGFIASVAPIHKHTHTVQECSLKDSDWAADSRHTDLVEPVIRCHYTLRHRAAVFLTIHTGKRKQLAVKEACIATVSLQVDGNFLSNFSSLCWLVVVLVVWQTTALMQFRKTHPCQPHKCTGNDYTKHTTNTLLCVSACVFSLFPAGMDINLSSTRKTIIILVQGRKGRFEPSERHTEK